VSLVFWGVRHGTLGAVQKQDTSLMPTPGVGSKAFKLRANMQSECLQEGFGEFSPGLAVAAGGSRASG
jgi:hypothetical protein